jgi:hypothetical protein
VLCGKKIEIRPDGGDSGSKKLKQGYGGTCGEVLRGFDADKTVINCVTV